MQHTKYLSQFLDAYHDLVDNMAKKYSVDPALVLGTVAESGFGQSRIFRENKDAFGMSGRKPQNSA